MSNDVGPKITMNCTRLALITGGSFVIGSGVLNFWVTYVKLNGPSTVPYPAALMITTVIGWLILIPSAFIARKIDHDSNKIARLAVLLGVFASLMGSLRIYTVS
jgi:Co/Zn/Cd efflux system component